MTVVAVVNPPPAELADSLIPGRENEDALVRAADEHYVFRVVVPQRPVVQHVALGLVRHLEPVLRFDLAHAVRDGLPHLVGHRQVVVRADVATQDAPRPCDERRLRLDAVGRRVRDRDGFARHLGRVRFVRHVFTPTGVPLYQP